MTRGIERLEMLVLSEKVGIESIVVINGQSINKIKIEE